MEQMCLHLLGYSECVRCKKTQQNKPNQTAADKSNHQNQKTVKKPGLIPKLTVALFLLPAIMSQFVFCT